MEPILETDRQLIEQLRNGQPMGISQLTVALGVTATAVRQRLRRLMAAGLVCRQTVRLGRGRPWHTYVLTDRGRRLGGSNNSDLAAALWQELRSVSDPQLRRGLLQRIMQRLADRYRDRMRGGTPAQRMAAIADLLAERDVHFAVEERDGLPVLKALTCPYTELAEQDRSICAMERMLFTELVDRPLRLGECRLDGAPCCTFELSSTGVEVPS